MVRGTVPDLGLKAKACCCYSRARIGEREGHLGRSGRANDVFR